MTNVEKIWLCFSICFPIFLFFCYLLILVYRRHVGRKNPEKLNRNVLPKIFVFSFLLFSGIFGVRLSLAYVLAKGKSSVVIALIDSFFYTLRAFSVEEGYPDLIGGIGKLAEALVSARSTCFSELKFALTGYITVLELLAPVVGAALILEVLAKVFPKFRLFFVCRFPFGRTRYYFSKLNAASLALAKSIAKEKSAEDQDGNKKKWYERKPVIIFTDTYIDDEKEKDYELLLEAKHCGAICVRDDLFHVRKPYFGKREYYLMDLDEFGNLQALMNLVEKSCLPYVLGSPIHLFVQSDAYISVEDKAKKKLEVNAKELKGINKLMWKRKGVPVVIPVRGYRNLISNLFREVPLYEPLIGRSGKADSLNVTILGNGMIGTEAFLHTYWMGQLLTPDEKGSLKDVELTINVISKDDPESFWSKLDYINPEIQRSAKVYKKQKAEDGKETVRLILPEKSIVRCYEEGEGEAENRPYCTIRYIQADVKNGGFWDGKQEEDYSLLGADYYIVALGSDADNISVAEKLRCLVGKAHLERKTFEDDTADHTVIAYAVFDSKIAEALNQQQLYSCYDIEKKDIYTYAFGSLDSVYSFDNVNMTQSRLLAEETGVRYQKVQGDSYLAAHKKRSDGDDENYKYWSNMAKVLFIKYKIFSLGWIKKSVFDGEEVHKKETEAQFLRYKRMALADGTNSASVTFDGENEIPCFAEQKELLAWLEHRRWCAYTRAEGYRYTAEVIKNLDLKGKSHKNMSLKLHPCLVEAERPVGKTYRHPKVISVFESKKTNEDVKKELDALEDEPLDRLDRLSCLMCREKLTRHIKAGDFKEYDRPAFDFDGYKLQDQMKQELKDRGVVLPKVLTDPEKCKDLFVQVKMENGETKLDRFIPVSKVKECLQRKYHKIEKNDVTGFLLELYSKKNEDKKNEDKKNEDKKNEDKKNEDKKVFIFEESLFMTRFAFCKAILRYRKEYFQALKEKKQAEKRKEQEDVSTETH